MAGFQDLLAAPKPPANPFTQLLAMAESPRERAWLERLLLNPDDAAQDPVAHDFGARGPTPVNMAKGVLAMPQRALEASARSFGASGGYIPGNTELVDRAADISTMLMGSGAVRQFGRGGATAEEIGIFGGRGAKNAPLKKLGVARALEKAGKSADDIWRETGWGRGADGEWRFEVDDSGAAVEWSNNLHPQPMSEVYKHPDLYKQYPEVGWIPAEQRWASQMPGGSTAAHLTDGHREAIVAASSMKPEFYRSVLPHETQHAVQIREGFAKGGMPNGTPPEKALIQQRKKAMTLSPEVFKQLNPNGSYKSYVAQVEKEAKKYASDETYRRLAGEVEARNVQKRLDMSAGERRATPPWATEDVPRDQQIVRRGAR